MDIVIEIISRSRRVIERHRFAGNSVTIGRAYDNDLIITDPHLNEHHARLIDLGMYGWQIEDLDSKNGTFISKNLRVKNRAAVQSGDVITLGKTHLRIIDRHHRVPSALSMNPVEKVLQPLSQTHNAISVLIAVILLFSLDSYLGTYIDFSFRHTLVDIFSIVMIGSGWALVWSLVGRLMRHDARFLVQFVIVMVFLAIEVVFSNFLDLLTFHGGSTVAFFTGMIGHFTLLAMLLWLNMYVALSQPDGKRLIMSVGTSGSVVSMMIIYYLLSIPEFSPVPDYNYYLKPPALQWINGKPVDEFLQDADIIFTVTSDQLD